MVKFFSRSCDRLISRLYLVRELVLANLLAPTKMRILISDTANLRASLERWFRYTRHEIEFGEFQAESIGDYDLLLPLNLVDIRRLDGMRQMAASNRLPVPGAEAIRLCDDKLSFNRLLIARGMSEYVPVLLDAPSPPYVLKKRISEGGKNTHLILDEAQEREIARDIARDIAADDYFRQELIEGRYEYATHVLFAGNRILRSLSLRYDMQHKARIKGDVKPNAQRIVRCTHLAVFAEVLSAVGFEGLCCIDYKIRDGRPLIMEVNPRIGGSLCPYFFSFVRDIAACPARACAVEPARCGGL